MITVKHTSSIKLNIILSTAYQILLIVAPLITTPYIARVLGPANLGIYGFTNSIQMFFSLFATLGTVAYGTREIARCRDDKRIRSKMFWEIELLTIFTTVFIMLVWLCWAGLSERYKIYYFILTLNILAVLFDVSWFYMGMENFKYIVGQNSIFKLLGILLIFVLVKSQDDLYIYVLIMALTVLLSNISMWIYLPRFVERIPMHELKVFAHTKDVVVYFIPTLATSIYTILDKTLIGIITNNEQQVGYYEEATKVINLSKAITFSSLNSVLGAHISHLFVEKKYEEIQDRIKKSIEYILFVGIGILFGLWGIADAFVPLFLGPGYDDVVVILKVFSPIVLIVGISNCLGSQYYTPIGLRKLSSKFIVLGALINLILNIVMIPKYESLGAVIASLLAESAITILYIINCKEFVKYNAWVASSIKRVIAGFVMLMVMKYIGTYNIYLFGKVALQFCAGACTYVLLLALFKDSLIAEFVKVLIRMTKKSEKG